MRTAKLARAAGLLPGAIERIEEDDEIESLSVRQVRELGYALGMDVLAELSRLSTADEQVDRDSSDECVLGAMLHRLDRPATLNALARGLEWTVDRVESALDRLAFECTRSGSGLVRSHGGIYITAAANGDAEKATRRVPRRLSEPVVRHDDVALVLEVAESWDARHCRPLEDFTEPKYGRILTLINEGVLAIEEHFVTLSSTTAESLRPVLELLALNAVARER